MRCLLVLWLVCCAGPATAQVAEGAPCAVTQDEIETRASEARDDLVACIKGTWHSMVAGGIPSGAVMAFNRRLCPTGWTDATPVLGGRFVMAAQDAAQMGRYGGSATHVLSIAEMPRHDHAFTLVSRGNSADVAFTVATGDGNTSYPHYQGTTETAGDNQAFSLMPPYVALLFCIKD